MTFNALYDEALEVIEMPSHLRREIVPEVSYASAEQQAQSSSQPKAVAITNPRWIHIDEELKQNSSAIAYLNNEIELIVDTSGIPDGTKLFFELFDENCTGSHESKVIGDGTGVVSGNCASCSVQIIESRSRSEIEEDREVALRFYAKYKNDFSENADVALEKQEDAIEIILDISPRDLRYENHRFILENNDNPDDTHTLTLGEHAGMPDADALILVFENLDVRATYKLYIQESELKKRELIQEAVIANFNCVKEDN